MTKIQINVGTPEEEIVLVCNGNHLLSSIQPELPNKILLRSCTKEILALVLSKYTANSVKRCLITGTPGIGKTVSIIALLYLVLQENLARPSERIILDLKHALTVIVHNGANNTWSEYSISQQDKDILTTLYPLISTLYIYDAVEQKSPRLLPYFSIVFSSPNINHFKEYIKISLELYHIYYMPTWSWNECLTMYNAYFKDKIVANLSEGNLLSLYEKWGGLPRNIFVDHIASITDLDDCISGCDVIACMTSIGKNLFYYPSEIAYKVRTKLMHLEVDGDSYGSARVSFGSPYIRDKLIEQSGKTASVFYRDFMATHGKAEFAAKVRGNIYEKLVLDKLSSNQDLTLFFFTMKKGFANSIIKKFQIPAVQLSNVFHTIEEITNTSAVWKPAQSNFNSFDALVIYQLVQQLMRQVMWVQITVGLTHSLLITGVHACFTYVPTSTFSNKIAFCLPPDIFQKWHLSNTVQNFVTKSGTVAKIHLQYTEMEQIVLCIPGDQVEAEQLNQMYENQDIQMAVIQ